MICENSDLTGQAVSDLAKKQSLQIHGLRQAACGGTYLENPIIPRLKPFAGDSALPAGSPSPGWLPAVRFIPCEGDPADQALEGRDVWNRGTHA